MTATTERTLTFADLTLNPETGAFTRAGRPGSLTRTETALLAFLMRHPRQVLTRRQILREVWGFDFRPKSDSLDVFVVYLRRKTEAGGEVRLLQTVRGTGYTLREPR